MYLGSQHAEEPFVTLGMIATALYFGWFLVLVPVVGVIENTLADILLKITKGINNSPGIFIYFPLE
jgi:ubiquinol-cytochrome c reductase cytochrome b subunit